MSKEPVSAKRIGMALGILGVFVWILFIFHSSDGFSKMGTIGEGWGALFIGVVVSLLCLFVLGLLIGWIVSGLRSAWSQDKRMVFTIIYCGLVALLLLIVPWRTHYDRSFSRWEGYSFVL